MRLIRKPFVNAFVVAVISALYGLIFYVTAENMEFTGMLGYDPDTGRGTLQSPFWNGWSVFLRMGYHRYIGYAFLLAALFVIILSFVRRKEFDEYQTGIFEKGLVVSGLLMMFLIPLWFLLILGDPCYIVEYAVMVVVIHWTALLVFDLVFLLSAGK